MINAQQIRAARALLEWKQSDLAEKSGISLASINNIERKIGSPRLETLRVLQATLMSAGIEFLGHDGVRRQSEAFAITEYNGENFIKDWFDDFAARMQGPTDVLRVCGLDERNFPALAPEQLLLFEAHKEKSGFLEKILIEEGDTFLLSDPCCYRWLSSQLLGTIPYLIYKDCFALAMYDAKRIIVVHSPSIAATFVRQFEFLWQQAKPVPVALKNRMHDPAYRQQVKKGKTKKK
jgi:transcriptional regulator with XRE-family HTH domain